METHWRFALCLAAALVGACAVISLVCARSFTERRWYRGFTCGKALLMAATGGVHLVLVPVLPFVDIFVGPWEKSLLNCFLCVSIAWETVDFFMALLFEWRFVKRGDWLWELFHHFSGASLAASAILLEVPLLVHTFMHFVVAQHAMIGGYKFWAWGFSSEVWREKWRGRVMYMALSHDVSKIAVGIIVMYKWTNGSGRSLDVDIFICANVIFVSMVLLTTMRKVFRYRTREFVEKEVPIPPITSDPNSLQVDTKTPPLAHIGQTGRVTVDTTVVTGLRGFACFHIALGHALMYWKGECDPDCAEFFFSEPKQWHLFGGVAVGLFYAVSGLVLTLGYGQKKYRPLSGGLLRGLLNVSTRKLLGMPKSTSTVDMAADCRDFDSWDFFVKRFRRIAMMYYLTNAVALALWVADDRFHTLAKERGVHFIVVRMLLWVFGLTSWSASYDLLPPNPVTWSISTMLFFYVMFPVFLPHVQRVPKQWLSPCIMRLVLIRMPCYMCGCTVAFLLGGTPLDSYWAARMFPPTAFMLFGMGCCCAYQVLDDHCQAKARDAEGHTSSSNLDGQQRVPRTCGIWLYLGNANVLCCLLLLTCFTCTVIRRFISVQLGNALHVEMDMLAPGLFPLVLRALCAPGQQKTVAAKFLRSRPLQFLGNISMSLYMVHYPVQMWFSWSLGYERALEQPSLPGWGILASLSTSLVLGWFLARYVEDFPKNLFKRRHHEIPCSAKGYEQTGKPELEDNGVSKSTVTPTEEEQPHVEKHNV
jgi:peptidoglycan/LPS O-acetylase OafA/YrhL